MKKEIFEKAIKAQESIDFLRKIINELERMNSDDRTSIYFIQGQKKMHLDGFLSNNLDLECSIMQDLHGYLSCILNEKIETQQEIFDNL